MNARRPKPAGEKRAACKHKEPTPVRFAGQGLRVYSGEQIARACCFTLEAGGIQSFARPFYNSILFDLKKKGSEIGKL